MAFLLVASPHRAFRVHIAARTEGDGAKLVQPELDIRCTSSYHPRCTIGVGRSPIQGRDPTFRDSDILIPAGSAIEEQVSPHPQELQP